MKRYLLLGVADLDVTWLEMGANGQHTTFHQMVKVKIFRPMPDGWTGWRAEGSTLNASFAPISLEIPKNQWLSVVPENKVPDNAIVMGEL